MDVDRIMEFQVEILSAIVSHIDVEFDTELFDKQSNFQYRASRVDLLDCAQERCLRRGSIDVQFMWSHVGGGITRFIMLIVVVLQIEGPRRLSASTKESPGKGGDPRDLVRVLNAFRHQRRNHSPECNSLNGRMLVSMISRIWVFSRRGGPAHSSFTPTYCVSSGKNRESRIGATASIDRNVCDTSPCNRFSSTLAPPEDDA